MRLLSVAYIGEFEILDDHRGSKIVINLRGRLKAICSAKAMGLEVLPMGVVRGGGRRGGDVTV